MINRNHLLLPIYHYIVHSHISQLAETKSEHNTNSPAIYSTNLIYSAIVFSRMGEGGKWKVKWFCGRFQMVYDVGLGVELVSGYFISFSQFEQCLI